MSRFTPPTKKRMAAAAPPQRKSSRGPRFGAAPPSASHDDKTGAPLSAGIRAEMEHAFGRDFAGVRVHQDSSAKALGAVAYTRGDQITFQPGRYAPETPVGMRVLAHELAHVVQHDRGATEPRMSEPGESAEREANAAANAALTGATPSFGGGGVPEVAALGEGAEDELHQPMIEAFRNERGLDKANGPSDAEIKYEILPEMVAEQRAQRVIDLAADTKVPIEKRAVAVVQAILDTYWPDDRGLIEKIVYDASDPGLTTASRNGANARGTLSVGSTFVKQTTRAGIARGVLQVQHELEHVRQHRKGMGGPGRTNEREFLAYHLEAMAREARGTGQVDAPTRVRLIDEALRRYKLLDPKLQKDYRSKFDELVKRRGELRPARPAPANPTPGRP